MSDESDQYRHLDEPEPEPAEYPDEPLEVEGPPEIGGKGFLIDIHDPDALAKMTKRMEKAIEESRALQEQAEEGLRHLMRRAYQPGFFDWYLDSFRNVMPPSVRAEFIAQAALERRIAGLEELWVKTTEIEGLGDN